MNLRVPFFALLGLVSCTYALQAVPVPVPGSDSRTLLRVHSTLREQVRPDTVLQNDIDRLITRGGGLIAIASSGLDEFRPEVDAYNGRGTQADLAALGAALTAASVGTASDCSFNGFGRTGPIEITWYGRMGRRNVFTILFVQGEPPESERCSAATRAVFDAIEIFEEQTFRNP